jgi:DNA-binding transcriptional ArsR family regulator
MPHSKPMAAAIQVVQSASSAEKLLKPERLRMLEMLSDPGSASGIAKRLNLPRQTVNYHLKELEKEGFVEFVEQRPKGNCLERFVRATARSYVISPQALGALGIDAGGLCDRFSAAYLISAASRAIRDVSILRQRADKAGKTLGTLTIETEIRFANAAERQEFTQELANCVTRLAMKFHKPNSEDGRSFRLVLGAYPAIAKPEPVDNGSVQLE